ncbi:proline-rich membrane anchor 1 [Protopterus annectens]|uniref:proline-rich membrane anchor 1 n=1 Tax=Protopterus annectens TaxID=7888 RepID=UPI001CF93B2F|nr:proline-rich membrane anchor 1 [Protopterus annectens]
MLLQYLHLTLHAWPTLLAHCYLAPLLFLCQIAVAEVQKGCSSSVMEKAKEKCQSICLCRPPPLLPPPPPPPPPPRLIAAPTIQSTFCPAEKPWWTEMFIIIAVCCTTLIFLMVMVIVCYKTFKRTTTLQSRIFGNAV